MLSSEQHDLLVGRLYASAMGDIPWSATLDRIASVFGVGKALLQIQDSANELVGFELHGYSREFGANHYTGEIHRSDPRIPIFHAVAPGNIYFDDALYDVGEMNQDPRCRANNDALGVKYQLGAVLGLPDGATGWLTLLSTEAEGHASEKAIAAYRRLAPHMAQALSLGQVMQQNAVTQMVLLEAMASKADGVVMLGHCGTPTFMNDTARAILCAGDGLAYSEGLFATRRTPETCRLRGMIRDAITASQRRDVCPGGRMLVTRPSGSRPYILSIMAAPPVERFLTGKSIACVIHIHDLTTVRLPSKSALRGVFGLSEREADFAVELARCSGLQQAAVKAGMAPNTARNHLHSIFRKTGAANRAEAVAMFDRLT